MSIELDDTIRGIWFMGLPALPGDFMGAVNETDDAYEFNYRFRYYKDDKVHDSEDTKNWYKTTVKKNEGSLDRLIKLIDELLDKLEELNPSEAGHKPDGRYSLIRGDATFDQFFDEFKELPFVHAQVLDDHKNYDMEDTTNGS